MSSNSPNYNFLGELDIACFIYIYKYSIHQKLYSQYCSIKRYECKYMYEFIM